MGIKPFNYLVLVVMALCLVQLSFGVDLSRYTKPSKEVGKRLQSYNPKKSLRYPQEYGFGYYYQGDILLLPANGGRFAVNADETNMWPNATVPYEIDANFTVSEMETLRDAFEQFHNRTCIRFVPRLGQEQYVNITNKNEGCYSNVAMNPVQYINQLNLQTPSCLEEVGTPVHELMHTLGFYHEHSRPDRDNYIIIYYQNLAPEYQTPEFREANLDKKNAADGTDYGVPYNYGSVMHYSRYAGAGPDNKPVFKNKRLYVGDFGNPRGLSQSDVTQLKARYCQPQA